MGKASFFVFLKRRRRDLNLFFVQAGRRDLKILFFVLFAGEQEQNRVFFAGPAVAG